jgi:hypothetical protein
LRKKPTSALIVTRAEVHHTPGHDKGGMGAELELFIGQGHGFGPAALKGYPDNFSELALQGQINNSVPFDLACFHILEKGSRFCNRLDHRQVP